MGSTLKKFAGNHNLYEKKRITSKVAVAIKPSTSIEWLGHHRVIHIYIETVKYSWELKTKRLYQIRNSKTVVKRRKILRPIAIVVKIKNNEPNPLAKRFRTIDWHSRIKRIYLDKVEPALIWACMNLELCWQNKLMRSASIWFLQCAAIVANSVYQLYHKILAKKWHSVLNSSGYSSILTHTCVRCSLKHLILKCGPSTPQERLCPNNCITKVPS